MSKTVIGRNLPLYKGDYDKSKTYDVYDVVLHNGSSYVSKKKNNVGNALTNTEFWQLLAKQGEKPVNGVDYNTEQEKEEFKQAVVEDSKTDMDEYTAGKKTDLDNYTNIKKEELDKHESNLESIMTTTKDSLIEEIEHKQDGFDEHVTAKINEFSDNATEQTNTFNTNAESKTTEYNNNHTAKIEEFDTHADNKVVEFNENVDSVENELTELAGQMPWKTTEVSESIHIEDSAKYSRNKLDVAGNLKQEVSEVDNNIFDGIMELGTISSDTGNESNSTNIIRSKNYIDISELTQIRVVRNDGYTGQDHYVGFRFYDKDKNFLKYTTTSLNSIVPLNTITGIEGYKYFKFIVTNTSDLDLRYGINKNASETYEEYIPNKPSIDYPSMPVTTTGVQTIRKCKKNVLKNNLTDKTIEGLTITVKEDKSIVVNGTASNTVQLNILNDEASTKTLTSTEKYYIPKKKLFCSGCPANGSNTTYKFDIWSTVGTLLGTDIGNGFEFQNKSDIKWARIVIYKDCICNNLIFKPQIAAETIDYEPYIEEVFSLDLADKELAQIKDTRDRYDFAKKQWNKKIRKRVFNGSEEWVANNGWNTTYPEIFHAYINLADWKVGQKNAVLDKLKFYGYTNYADYVNKECCVCHASSAGLYLFIKADRLETFDVAGLKKFLAENNLTIWYELAESTYEDCTPAQSEVLDKLHKLSLAQGTNNIFAESENGVTVVLQLEYMQDNNLLREQEHQAMQEQIKALSEAILNLGGTVNV